MYRFSTRFIIVILTFVIGVFAVGGWLYYREFQKIIVISPVSRWDSLIFKQVNKAINLAGLTELRKTSVRDGDVEVRVWRGFSQSPLEGVIFKRTNNQWSGLYVKTNAHYEPEKAEVRQLNSPKSGWESFWQQLVNKEILTLPQSTENECDIPNADAVIYVVEINDGRMYRTFSYPQSNARKCREARQMADIGEFIGLEFDSSQEECKTTEWFACMMLRKRLNQISE